MAAAKAILVYRNTAGREPFTDWLNNMAEYRTLDDVTVEYFEQHPEEIEAFLHETFAGYAADGDSAALLSALRVIARVKGISTMAAEIGMTRQGLQKALSAKGNPRLDTINAIMRPWATSSCLVAWRKLPPKWFFRKVHRNPPEVVLCKSR